MHTVPLIKILVNDLDDAVAFYTERLGFTVREDRTLGNYRWLLVGLEGQPDFALNLDVALTDQQRALVGKQSADLPLFSISTDNCQRDYELWKERGVVFDSEPDVQPYGTGVMLRDIVGNRIYLNEEP